MSSKVAIVFKANESFRLRYTARLLASMVLPLFNIAIYAIVPRALGPAQYGTFSYLTQFFQQAIGIVDTGTSTSFYTKLSQRPQETSIIVFYSHFSGFVALFLSIALAAVFLLGYNELVWSEQGMFFTGLAAALAYFSWLGMVWNKIADAYALTIVSEIGHFLSRVLGLFLVIALWWLNVLSLEGFLYYSIFMAALFLMILVFIVERGGVFAHRDILSFEIPYRKYIGEFFRYCYPLFIYSLVTSGLLIVDRWLLQAYAGVVEQGFFGLAFQIGGVSFLFTSAMTPLLTREYAIAFQKQDMGRVRSLFRTVLPQFFVLTAFFACFISAESNFVVNLFGGEKFSGAALPMSLLAFYPIHQTYGQLSGSLFYATGRTKTYSIIGIATSVVGLGLSYILLMPEAKGGFNLGSSGLAAKLLLLQFLGVNVMLYFNSRLLGVNFRENFLHQFQVVILFGGLAFGIRELSYFFPCGINMRFVLSGFLYSSAVLIAILCFPGLLSLSWRDLLSLIKARSIRINS